MKIEGKETKTQSGTIDFNGCGGHRFPAGLAVEYLPIDNIKSRPGHTMDIGENGMSLSLREDLEVGQKLGLCLFIGDMPEFISIEAVVEVVWKDPEHGRNKVSKAGAKFVDIAVEDMNKLRKYIEKLRLV